jgi:hypothetical protein
MPSTACGAMAGTFVCARNGTCATNKIAAMNPTARDNVFFIWQGIG